MAELSQKQLEELVVGKPGQPNVVFFDKSKIDPLESQKAGRRVYKTRTYVKMTYPGQTDWVAELATQDVIDAHPEEYQHYLNNKHEVRAAGVDLIPGLKLEHVQELIDYGLSTVPALAKATVVPPHLEYAQRMAQRIQAAIEGANDVEERIEESHQEAQPEGRGIPGAREAEDVHAVDRRIERGPVGRPAPETRRPVMGADFDLEVRF